MEIRSVGVGIVAIRSVHSGFYLAMNRKGKIYGTVTLQLPSFHARQGLGADTKMPLTTNRRGWLVLKEKNTPSRVDFHS